MLSTSEIRLMEHALGTDWNEKGYHYKRHGKQYVKSYRNRYCTYGGDDEWEELVKRDFASSFISPYDNKYTYYQVTDNGIKELEKERNYTIRFI